MVINMFKTVVKIDGMMCGMCEAHINDAIRSALSPRKVTSSHSKGEAVIITENIPDEETLKSVINATGYTALSVSTEPYEKKGLLRIFKR